MKKITITIITLLVASLGLLAFFYEQRPSTPEEISNEDLLQFVVSEYPAFLHDNKPVIEIESVSRHDNRWYIVTIKSLREVETFIPVRLVLVESVESDGNMSVILEPATHFTEPEMLRHNIPDSIIRELQQS